MSLRHEWECDWCGDRRKAEPGADGNFACPWSEFDVPRELGGRGVWQLCYPCADVARTAERELAEHVRAAWRARIAKRAERTA